MTNVPLWCLVQSDGGLCPGMAILLYCGIVQLAGTFYFSHWTLNWHRAHPALDCYSTMEQSVRALFLRLGLAAVDLQCRFHTNNNSGRIFNSPSTCTGNRTPPVAEVLWLFTADFTVCNALVKICGKSTCNAC